MSDATPPVTIARSMLLAFVLGLVSACASEHKPDAFEAREIFVIGDSITTGYGALGPGPDCAATDATHSADAAYAAVLARRLKAKLIVDAVSGRGLVHNVEGQPAPTVKALLLDGGAIRSGRYRRLSPELVLIHIGTNDHFQNDPGPAFEAAYVDLLETLAGAYPDARLVGLFGPSLSGGDRARAVGAITRAIETAEGTTGREIGFLQLDYDDDPVTAIGCDWHPGVSTHAAMAAAIADYLGAAP
jgi:lysophospholipase L1-like esterase